jgi:hypothetical protein
MAPQFIRIETYGREGAHKKNSTERKSSMFAIRDEMIREPHACGHVPSPQPPVVLFGNHPSKIIAICAEQASRAIDKAGRKLRRDAPVMVSGVVTWPQRRDVVDNNPEELKRYELWLDDTVAWLQERWGDALASVVEHVDEPFAHFHFVLVPKLDHNSRLWIGTIHPGHCAEAEAAAAGGCKLDQKKAHSAAMKQLQDDYYQEVGAKHGLTRIGPARQRLTRAEWKEQKRQAESLAAAHRSARQFAANAKAAAERRIAEQAAMADFALRSEIAAVEERANRRVTALREKAVLHVKTLGTRASELQQELKQRDATIADQTAEIRTLEEMLQEHGILKRPKA